LPRWREDRRYRRTVVLYGGRVMADGRNAAAPEAARQAASRGDWQEAFELFMALDAGGALEPGDVPLLAEVAYAAGHLDVTIAAWERVHRVAVEADDHVAAAGAAARVAMHLLFDTALMAPVRGWLRRAERHLEGRPESSAHAWHAVVCAYERLLSGDRKPAHEFAARAIEMGSRFDPAAGAMGQVAAARLLLLDDDVDAGLALLEDVGVTATGGDLDPLSTGVVYCELVCALQGVTQYDLAEEWTEAMERWCASHAIGSLHGRCRVHRAEILRLRGRYEEAEAEAAAACEELRLYVRRELGWPLTELGQIRLRRGDERGAETALLAAQELGWDPQPTLARVHLLRGDVAGAAGAIHSALERPAFVPSKERPPDHQLQRAPLLAAQVEIEVAAGDINRAREAADELETVARRFRSRALVGEAELAQGRVCLAERDAAAAVEHLEAAARIWGDIQAPYELALTRIELAAAHRVLGATHEAEREEQAGRQLLDSIRAGDNHLGAKAAITRSGDAANRLVRAGDFWVAEYDGRIAHIRDLKGIHYLVRMLGDPGREFHVLDLVTAANPRPADASGSHREQGQIAFADAGEMIDDQARTAYRRRLEEIDEDIDEATSAGDLGRVEQARAERDFLRRELSRAFGLGGRTRRAHATSERARVAVTRALRTAIERIGDHNDAMGRHLGHSILTGTYCSYQPDPGSPVTWQL
jgi:tetratricopeptide (TPR) repeat protein